MFEIKRLKHVIDCDASPFCPDGWKVVEHRKGGQLEFDVSKIQQYLSERQQKEYSSIRGRKLQEELKNKTILNANVLDYLLKNFQIILNNWKTLYFWGTIYRMCDGHLVVRCLDRSGGNCGWHYNRLDYDFGGGSFAAVVIN